MTLPLLRCLSDGAFHSGEELAEQFGVSRASISNALKGAQELGVTLFKVKGRGYRLSSAIEWLDPVLVSANLTAHDYPLSLQIQDVVTSTNSELMRQTSQYAGVPICLAAEIQTQGRGRRGKSWYSSVGGALTFSLLWQFNSGAAQLSGLSLAVGIGLVRTMKEIGIEDVQLKWPNDLMSRFHKLGGILVELQGDALGPSSTVIGVGMNVQLDDEIKNKIDQAATDINSLTSQSISRNALLSVTLRNLMTVLREFERDGFEKMQPEWQQYHAYHERMVSLRLADGTQISGVVKGVAADGCLKLQTNQGMRLFGSGEVSLRPPESASNQ